MGDRVGLGDAGGFVEVDPATLQHVPYRNVFALGDATSTPPATNTGAAIRRQAPVLVQNLRAQMAGRPLPALDDGYSACPITTARGKVLLAEFDYDLAVTPLVPLVDTVIPRRDMWLLKKYGLPALYWNLMLKGLA